MHRCFNHPEGYACGGIALGGAHFDNPDSSLSGFGDDVPAYLHILADGGVFIDCRTVPVEGIAHLAIAGPMLDLRLGAREVRRFNLHRELAAMRPGLDGGFGAIADLALSLEDFSGFDCVGLDVYAALRRSYGARIGIRKGDAMVWEDGGFTVITPCGCRR